MASKPKRIKNKYPIEGYSYPILPPPSTSSDFLREYNRLTDPSTFKSPKDEAGNFLAGVTVGIIGIIVGLFIYGTTKQ